MIATPLKERGGYSGKWKDGGGSLAVVVRAAIVTVPWEVRIIIRRVISVIARLGRANPAIGVINIGAAD